MAQMFAYIGTYTRDGSEGIYICHYNPDTGALAEVGVAKSNNSSFLALHPTGQYLYAINEAGDYQGEKAGDLSAFSINRTTGALTFLNQLSTQGAAPCHVCVTNDGTCAIVVNYSGGSTCAFELATDGSLKTVSTFIQHTGSSIHPKRQEGPHAHSANLDAQNCFVYVADLGLDKVLIYKVNNGKLTPANPAFVTVTPGQGPRHFDFHPNGKYAYLINEIGNTVCAYTCNATTGALTEIQNIPTLPNSFSGNSHTADIHVSPDGKYLYGSNRGHNSIVIYAIDQATGKLTLVGHEPTGGDNPRNFAIDPAGNFLLVANQNTHTIVSFRIDKTSGKLQATGQEIRVPRPVCIKFLQ